MNIEGAKVLAVLLCLLPFPGTAEERALGRLFFSAGQRAGMDVARREGGRIGVEYPARQNDALPVARLTLDGVVTRSDGKTTVWINHREQSGEHPDPAIVVQGRNGVRGQVGVIASDAKHPVPLKVGQSIDLTSGRVEENYRLAAPDRMDDPPADDGDIAPVP